MRLKSKIKFMKLLAELVSSRECVKNSHFLQTGASFSTGLVAAVSFQIKTLFGNNNFIRC